MINFGEVIYRNCSYQLTDIETWLIAIITNCFSDTTYPGKKMCAVPLNVLSDYIGNSGCYLMPNITMYYIYFNAFA